LATRQIAQLNDVRAKRDKGAVDKALGALRAAAGGTDNLMPPIIDSVRAYATLGEICDVMRGEFGEYRPPNII
jgi:methylmalonyl-CoA mutase N-terminal domain/subunit